MRRAESVQTLNIWVYGDRDRLERGSGLRVGEEGIVFNHHFLLPGDGTGFTFVPGDYSVEVWANLVGRAQFDRCPRILSIAGSIVERSWVRTTRSCLAAHSGMSGSSAPTISGICCTRAVSSCGARRNKPRTIAIRGFSSASHFTDLSCVQEGVHVTPTAANSVTAIVQSLPRLRPD
jgi:hypothetical protein